MPLLNMTHNECVNCGKGLNSHLGQKIGYGSICRKERGLKTALIVAPAGTCGDHHPDYHIKHLPTDFQSIANYLAYRTDFDIAIMRIMGEDAVPWDDDGHWYAMWDLRGKPYEVFRFLQDGDLPSRYIPGDNYDELSPRQETARQELLSERWIFEIVHKDYKEACRLHAYCGPYDGLDPENQPGIIQLYEDFDEKAASEDSYWCYHCCQCCTGEFTYISEDADRSIEEADRRFEEEWAELSEHLKEFEGTWVLDVAKDFCLRRAYSEDTLVEIAMGLHEIDLNSYIVEQVFADYNLLTAGDFDFPFEKFNEETIILDGEKVYGKTDFLLA